MISFRMKFTVKILLLYILFYFFLIFIETSYLNIILFKQWSKSILKQIQKITNLKKIITDKSGKRTLILIRSKVDYGLILGSSNFNQMGAGVVFSKKWQRDISHSSMINIYLWKHEKWTFSTSPETLWKQQYRYCLGRNLLPTLVSNVYCRIQSNDTTKTQR